MRKIFLAFLFICLVNESWYFVRTLTFANSQPHISLTTSDLDSLLDVQWSVIYNFDSVVRKRKYALSFLKRDMERIQKELSKAKNDFKHYSGNPINAFTMIRRMTEGLDFFKIILQENAKVTRDNSLKYPSNEVLQAAVRMILRLQRVYKLNVTELADGLLKTSYGGDGRINKEIFLPMKASDCFEISKVMYEINEHKPGIPWLLESLRLYMKERPVLGLNKNYIKQYLSQGYEVLNNKHNVRKKERLSLNPSHDKENILYVEGKKKTESLSKYLSKPGISVKQIRANLHKRIRMLCRDELEMAQEISKSLKCWYFPGHRPFSRLAPFRAEQLFVQPDITLIHDAISSNEIEILQNTAKPKETTDSYQFAKVATLTVRQTQLIMPVIDRIMDMTGILEIHTPLLVANYGVGGQFKCHLDQLYGNKTSNEARNADFKQYDSRITVTTAMFYLSDVEQGGATIFPMLTVRVFPMKGAALYWSNHLPSGEVDQILQHGACPVLRGSRWTVAQLINDADQTMIRPCTKKITSRQPEDIPLPTLKNPY